MYFIIYVFKDEENNDFKGSTVSHELFKLALSSKHLFYQGKEDNKWQQKDSQKLLFKQIKHSLWQEGDTFHITKNIWGIITEKRELNKIK